MRKIFSLVLIFIIMFTFSACSGNYEIKNEAHNMSDCILNNLSNSNINCSGIRYSDKGILIELYGSDSAQDVMEIANFSNQWMEDNSESIICNNSLNVSIELYLDKPNETDREYLNYIAAFSDFSVGYDRDISTRIDCLQILQCHEFSTSLLNNGNDYRVIILPTTVFIDDFDVFINMESLEYVIIEDYMFDDITVPSDELNTRIEEITNNYDDINFYIGII